MTDVVVTRSFRLDYNYYGQKYNKKPLEENLVSEINQYWKQLNFQQN